MKYDWIDAYLLGKAGVHSDFKAEWGWQRYMLHDKMFAAICCNDQQEAVFITLKLDPLQGEFLRGQYADIIPGYYMNKTHWNSVKADGQVPDNLLKAMLDKSYDLILHSMSKKLQREILGIE